jgi:hypothetical protein
MGIFSTPGFLTDVQDSGKPLGELAALGYKWISYQVQNDTQTKDRDLSAARSAGLSPGVWGVSYHAEHLARDAQVLRAIATTTGADHIIFNVEAAFNPAPYIDVFRSYDKPKALITLNGILPDLDTAALVDAGWVIMPEAYLCDAPTLTPDVVKWYCEREGIPPTHYNLCLGMYKGANGRITGAEYAYRLGEAGVGNQFSAYMLEHGTLQDYIDLSKHITTPKDVLEKLKLTNTGINAVLDNLEKVFDANGIPEPDGVDALRAHLLAVGTKINEIIDEL